MNSPSLETAVSEPLRQLTRRVRWKRWLSKLHRFAWLLAAAFLALFLADALLGMRTLSLRVAFGGFLALAVLFAAVDWVRSWLADIDLVGLAHLLEKRYPELAERLVTLVQVEADQPPSRLTPLLQAETAQRLAGVDPNDACPLERERRVWALTAILLAALLVSLSFMPAFGAFTNRFFRAWTTPLVPYEIVVTPGTSYALRGGSHEATATVRMLDEHAEAPTQVELVCEDETAGQTTIAMKPAPEGRFAATLENLRRPLRCRVQAGDAVSATFEIRLIDAPAFSTRPSVVAMPPKYLQTLVPIQEFALDEANPRQIEVLQYCQMYFQLPLDRQPVKAALRIIRQPTSASESAMTSTFSVQWKGNVGAAQSIAAVRGPYQAELVLELEHGLTTTLPLKGWSVHADGAPRFTQPLRLQGGESVLVSSGEYRIAPGDALKLQTAVEDDEGLDAVAIDWRINGGTPRLEKWLNAAGKKKLVINDWLPLPSSLKEGDRVQFRLHASDNRRMQKGEIEGKGEVIPKENLLPQVTIAPGAPAGEEAWVTLRVDRSIEGFLKQQAQAQADEVRDVIGKIRQKVINEIEQVQQLQRPIHQQFALSPAQIKEAETLRTLNREIEEDLLSAGQRFLANPDLAKLAEHFFEIAEIDMKKSAEALERFGAKDRSMSEAEKELQSSQDALVQARKKLERMLDWNKLVAQDRLDQFQIDKLLKRQNELAERLQKLRNEEPKSNEEMAKQIEAIRQEQARIAEQTAELQEKSRLVQESAQALQQMRLQKLIQEAEQVAAQQRSMRALDPAKMPAEIKARLDKIAERQADLAGRVQPFAKTSEGPDVKPAQAAADALKKPKVEEALQQQKEHEKRLNDWLGQLEPGVALNALREQILQLAKKQQAIRADLERLGQDLPRLDDKMQQQRLRDLTARQKEMSPAIAKLPVNVKDDRLRSAQQGAERTARQAGDQLAAKDALASFFSMEKAQKQLEAMAGMMPSRLPIDRAEIKDPAKRAKIEQVEKFGREQEKLRAETERLLADWMKTASEHGNDPLREKTEKLAADLLKLAQQGAGPEAKAMAKEAANAVEEAKKAMDSSQALKTKGDVEESKKMDDAAEKQLELAVKQLGKLAQARDAKEMAKDHNPTKTAEALQESAKEMRKAEATLPTTPTDAQAAMKAAAKALEQAVQAASKQSASKLPNAARNPAPRPATHTAGAFPGSVPRIAPHEPSLGKTWGELPGELRTRMLQDIGSRFGEEYAEVIRQYFESLAELPPMQRKE